MFIKITTSNYLIVHGYDDQNKEIIETVTVEKPMVKIVAVSRIQSISDKYILVTGSHGRLMYWAYEESFEDLELLLKRHQQLLF